MRWSLINFLEFNLYFYWLNYFAVWVTVLLRTLSRCGNTTTGTGDRSRIFKTELKVRCEPFLARPDIIRHSRFSSNNSKSGWYTMRMIQLPYATDEIYHLDKWITQVLGVVASIYFKSMVEIWSTQSDIRCEWGVKILFVIQQLSMFLMYMKRNYSLGDLVVHFPTSVPRCHQYNNRTLDNHFRFCIHVSAERSVRLKESSYGMENWLLW